MINQRLVALIVVLLIIGITYYILTRRSEQYEPTAEEREEMEASFHKMDRDKNGEITKSEFEEIINLSTKFGLNTDDVKPEMFEILDTNGDGIIKLEELLKFLGNKTNTPEDTLKMMFRIIDTDNNDNLSEAEFMKGDVEFEKLGIDASTLKLVEFKQIDQNNDKIVTLEEMIKAMKPDEAKLQKKGTEYIFRVMDVDENKKLTQKEFDEGIDVLGGIGIDTSDIKSADFKRFDYNDDSAVTLEEMSHFMEVNQSSN